MFPNAFRLSIISRTVFDSAFYIGKAVRKKAAILEIMAFVTNALFVLYEFLKSDLILSQKASMS